jgi:hypothetical protein
MQNKIFETFGDRLKFYRGNVLKITRKDFGQKYGFSSRALQVWEDNEFSPNRSSIEKLRNAFKSEDIAYNEEWLFEGIGDPFTIAIPKEKEDKTSLLESDYIEISHVINSFTYEPLLRKNTKLVLEPAKCHDINCPAFVAFKENNTFHFGILMHTRNKEYILKSYDGTFYELLIKEGDILFLIKKIN